MSVKNEVGNVYSRWTVLEFTGVSKNGHVTWLCRCECGKKEVVFGTNLRRGLTKSCGCYKKDNKNNAKTHGYTHHSLYAVYDSMISRCYNKNNHAFHRYGGRGISVCEEWRNSRVAFFGWAEGSGHKNGLQIDRIDNDGPYCVENCRFVTRKVNTRNTRKNRIVRYKGENMTFAEFVERFVDCSYATAFYRLNRGLSPEEIVNTPVRKMSKEHETVNYMGQEMTRKEFTKQYASHCSDSVMRSRLSRNWSIGKIIATPVRGHV